MPAVGTTAVVAALPVADRLLAVAAEIDPRSVRAGISAHATILYPFLPAPSVTPDVLDALRARSRGLGPVEVTLDAMSVHGGFVGVLAPALDEVTASIRAGWPALSPYGGRFGPSPPVHVTVAMEATEAETIVARVAELLPMSDLVTELRLMALGEPGWASLATIPL